MNARRFLWYVRRLPEHLGMFGMIGLVLMLASAGTWLQGIRPAIKQSSQLNDRLDIAEASARQALQQAISAPPVARPPEIKLLDRAVFPAYVQQLMALANKHGVSLPEGDYKTTSEIPGQLDRIYLSFAFKEEYPRLRAWLEALESIEGTRIEAVQMGRASIEATQLEVLLQLSVLVKAEKAAP